MRGLPVLDMSRETASNARRSCWAWAVTTQPWRPAEEPTRGTAALGDKAFTTTRTFVDGVGRQAALALQLTAEVRLVRC